MNLIKRLYKIDLDLEKIKEGIVTNPISRAVYTQASSFLNDYYIQIKGFQLFSKENQIALCLPGLPINPNTTYNDLGMDIYGIEGGFLRGIPLLTGLTLPCYLPSIVFRITEEGISKIFKKDIRGFFSSITADATSFLFFFNTFKRVLPYVSVAYAEYVMSSNSLIAFYGIASTALVIANEAFLFYSSFKQYLSPEFRKKFNNFVSLFDLLQEKISKYIKKLGPGQLNP